MGAKLPREDYVRQRGDFGLRGHTDSGEKAGGCVARGGARHACTLYYLSVVSYSIPSNATAWSSKAARALESSVSTSRRKAVER